MAVRNFWLDASVDGRETDLAGGPRSKDGGFELTITQRDDGSITKALRVIGLVHEGGVLETRVIDSTGAVIFSNYTTR